MNKIYTEISNCRVCGSRELEQVLHFEPQYLHSLFVKSNENHPLANVKIPMGLMLCKGCGLVQLKQTVAPEVMYTDYFYRSETNEVMLKELRDVVDKTLEKVVLKDGDVFLDIACNDCSMLKMVPSNLKRIGIDPATNIQRSNLEDIVVIQDYFNEKAVRKEIGDKKVKVITCTAAFYDISDPVSALKEIRNLLDDDGICTIQVSYLLDTIRDFNYYDATWEHIYMYTLKTINDVVEKSGMYIYSCDTNFTNGGSIRIYISKSEKEKTDRFYKQLEEEEKWELDNLSTYQKFSDKIEEMSKKILDFIVEEKNRGGLVIAVGASTKGNVLLQRCGLTKELIPVISERNPIKFGMKTLGTNIEMISEEDARKLNPTVMFILPWCFRDSIISREQDFLNKGGKFLLAMPYAYCLDKSGEHKL